MAFNLPEADSLLRTEFLPQFIDAVFTSNKLFEILYPQRLTLAGGQTFTIPLIYADEVDGEGGYYDDATDQLPLEQADHINTLTFGWASHVQPITITNRDLAKFGNDSLSALNLLQARTEAAALSARSRIQRNMFLPAGTGPMGLLGLEDVFTGVNYGQIDAVTETWWAAQQVANNAGAAGALNLRQLALAIQQASEDDIAPNLILSSKDVYARYWSLLQAQERYAAGGSNAGAPPTGPLYFQSIPWYPMSKITTTSILFALNTQFLKLVVVNGWDNHYKELKDVPGTQRMQAEIHFFYQLICTNRRYQLRYSNIDPAA